MSTQIRPGARRIGALVAMLAFFALLPGAVQTAPAVTFVVDTTTDAVDANIGDGQCATAASKCSLRAAIQESNFQTTDETIQLAVPPPSPGTPPRYDLTITGRGEDVSATGDLDITDDVQIVGLSTPLAVIDGLDADRVLDIRPCPACAVVLADLDLVNGSAQSALDASDRSGAGIRVDGANLTLLGAGVFDSTAQDGGGGIANMGGDVELLEGSIVEDNTAGMSGAGNGAGIANVSGLLTLDDAWILGNHSVCGSGAGIYNAGTLDVHDVLFDGNVADCQAGGIANAASGSATITDSTFSANLADDGAGLINAGTATVRRSTFSGNDAFFAYGGAIVNSGSLTLENSTLHRNHAERRGGGIFTWGGTATLTNVTVSQNEASNRRGPVHAELAGGGVYVGGGAVLLRNTILAFNTRVADGSSSPSNCAGSPVTSMGWHNLDSGTTCGFGSGDLQNVDPLLGLLQDNGGLTYTQALGAGSPAVDVGDNSVCPATDQRGTGFPRPVDGNGDGSAVCDLGAYEGPAVAPPPPVGGGGGGGGSGGGGGGALPDLKLVGSVNPAQAPVGGAVTFVLIASTPDDTPAERVFVTANVPAGLTIAGTTSDRGSGCGPPTGNVLVCSLDFLAGGAAKVGTITIGATVAQAGEQSLTATLTSRAGDRNTADNTVELTVNTPAVVTPQPPLPPGPSAPTGKRLIGTSAANILRGGAGPDLLDGRGGDDSLYGGAGNDRLLGGLGNDRLVGGPGRDTLLGGGGNDRLESRDGARDQVGCGTGKRDVAIVDRKDVVGRDCEIVRRG